MSVIGEERRRGAGILCLEDLQGRIRCDSESYKEDYILQWQRIVKLLDLLVLDPGGNNEELIGSLQLVSNVAHLYPEVGKTLPNDLTTTFKEYFSVIHPDTRLAILKAIISLKTNALISYEEVIPLLLCVLRCNDKAVRRLVSGHILRSVKIACAKNKNQPYSNYLCNKLCGVLRDESENESCRVKVIELIVCMCTRGMWQDSNTINIIANACFSKTSQKISLVALRFFLGLNEFDEDRDGFNAENNDGGKNISSMKHSMKVGRLTGSKKRVLKRLESKKNKKFLKENRRFFTPYAIQLINNPYDFAERLLSKAKKARVIVPFETRLLCLDLSTRVINAHKLIIVSFYEYILQYLRPSQREVSSLLAFTARATHDLVPPYLISPLLKAIADNFVWNSLSSEIVTSGLSAMRLICARCPLAMPEDLLNSLIEDYKGHKDKASRDAARSLLNLYRSYNPKILKRKNRGKGASMVIARKKILVRGMQEAPTNVITGLIKNIKKGAISDPSEYTTTLNPSEHTTPDPNEYAVSDCDSYIKEDDNNNSVENNVDDNMNDANENFDDNMNNFDENDIINIDPKTEVLTNEQFELLKSRHNNDYSSDEETDEEITEKDIIKKAMRRKDYEARMESVMKGREGRVYKCIKSLKEHSGGTSNKMKAKKNKNFCMSRVSKRKSGVDKRLLRKTKRGFGKKKK